jgi:hypothetical protein
MTLLEKIAIQTILKYVQHKFDLHVDSCVNNEADVFSRKSNKGMKVFKHIALVELYSNRGLFTNTR